MKKPTLQQLSYLVALADEGHFGRAADACHVSQPGLSTQIKELEQRLGAMLVERLAKGIRLTPEGTQVVAQSRRILREVYEMAEASHTTTSSIDGPIVVGAIPTLAPYILGDFVPAVLNSHPKATLRFQELRTSELLAALRSGALDVALCALPVEGDDLTSVPVFVDHFLLAVSSKDELSIGANSLPLSVLTNLNVLLLDEGHCLRDQALEVCSTTKAQSTDLRATSLATLVQMVAAHNGVTLLPVTAASVEARAGNGIAVRHFIGAPWRTVAMTWRASSPRDRFYRAIAVDFSRGLEHFQTLSLD